MIFKIVSRIRAGVIRWWEKHQIQEIRNLPNLKCGKDVLITGVPVIRVHHDASITLGDGVMLNSSQEIVHTCAYGPVSLLATHPGAKIRIGDRTRFHASSIRAYSSVTIG